MKCWEFKKCGREKGGNNEKTLGICPSYPDYGDCCAPVAGTLCQGKIQGTFAQKLESCAQCNFFNSAEYNRERTSEIMLVMLTKK